MPNRFQMLLLYPICMLAGLVMAVWLPIAILAGSRRAIPMMIAADRMANATFGGSDRETISSRAYRGTREGVRGWCLLCKLLDAIDRDHCKLSDGY